MFTRRDVRHNRGRASGAANALQPIWPPTRLSGLVGWWDAQETLTQAGGFVSSIRNMASGVDWTEAVNQPAYDATGINGRPCMVGDGATSSRRIISTEAPVVSAFSGAAKTLTFITVVQPAVSTQTAGIIGAGNSALVANSSWRVGTVATAPGLWMMAKRGTAAANVNGTTQVSTSPIVVSYRTDGTSADLFLNLASELSGAAFVDSGTPAPDRVALLAYPVQTVASFYNGKFGAGLLYTSALTDSQVRGLVLGLRQRWGI